MRPLAALALVAVSAASSALLVLLSYRTSQPLRSPVVGLYEYQPSQVQPGEFGIETTFINWSDPQLLTQLRSFLHQAQLRRRVPLLTLEPFPGTEPRASSNALLSQVLSGRYDHVIDGIGRTLAAHRGVVLLRFAHEMDKPRQYPWAYADPDRYIRLYRYVFRRIAVERPSNLRWVWSPAGESNAHHYWPGGAYVDLIGVSIYASRAWSPNGSLESFVQQLDRKRWLGQRFARPLLIAEAGVSGSADDQQRWIREALAALPRYPDVCGFVYFQAPQPRWMPLPTGHEDWALSPPALRWLKQALPLEPRHGSSCVEV